MPLTEAIIYTLAYFDIFDYPLTATEIQNFLWSGKLIALETIEETLPKLIATKNIQTKNGFFFLPYREETVQTRQKSVRHVAQKLDRAKRAGKIIRHIPFVQSMFVCNTVAAGSAHEASDIDVLIIVKKGRIWFSRLLVTALLHLFSLRRHGKKITDRICLSFYLTSDHLNLRPIAIGDDDIYLHYWIRQLLPIYDPNNLWQKMQSANGWIDKNTPRPTCPPKLIGRYRVDDSKKSTLVKKILEKFWSGRYGDLIESQAKGLQEAHMKRHSTPIHYRRNVVVNDNMMKFHENDRREYFRDEWRRRCQQFLKSNS